MYRCPNHNAYCCIFGRMMTQLPCWLFLSLWFCLTCFQNFYLNNYFKYNPANPGVKGVNFPEKFVIKFVFIYIFFLLLSLFLHEMFNFLIFFFFNFIFSSFVGKNFATLKDFDSNEIQQFLWTANDLKIRFKQDKEVILFLKSFFFFLLLFWSKYHLRYCTFFSHLL